MDKRGNLDPEENCDGTDAVIVPPDGGWGWVVVFAVFIGNCLMDGCIGSFGIFYPEQMRAFGSGPVVTSLAGSLLPAVYMMSSPVVGSLYTRYGSRPLCFVGGCIGSAGLILASVSSNIAVFIVTFGVVVGIGIGMNFLPGHVITNTYFDKKRGVVGGINFAGAGFGVFILAPVIQILLTEYGWRGAMLLLAGIFMQLCVCSTVMRPLRPQKRNAAYSLNCKRDEMMAVNESEPMLSDEQQRQRVENQSFESKSISTENNYIKLEKTDVLTRIKTPDRCSSETTLTTENKPYVGNGVDNQVTKSLQEISSQPASKAYDMMSSSQFLEPILIITRSQIIFEEKATVGSDVCDRTLCRTLSSWKETTCDMSVFKNKNYIPLLLGGIFIQTGQFIPNTFLPDYCFTIGLDGKQMAVIMSIYGLLNILGRLSAGGLANVKGIDALWLCNLGVFLSGVGCALFSFCTTFTSLCVYAIAVGYFIGYFPPLQVIIMVEYFGIDKLPSALGLLQFAKGPAALFGPPVAGLVYQYSQNYALSMGFAAILFILSFVIQSLVPFLNMCSKQNLALQTDTDIETTET